jgi:hypothetical protein
LGSHGELDGAAVASSWAGVRSRKKAWTWWMRPWIVKVGELASHAFSAAQIRSVGLSWAL